MQRYQCPKCDSIWIPRVEKPKKCPTCSFRLSTLGKAYDRMVLMKEMNANSEKRASKGVPLYEVLSDTARSSSSLEIDIS